jgi:hypothetical protein|tara:strand:- start:159 stop:401 length:243 start_codon:yes stop_codon:yes gene_type:complete
MEYQPLLVLLGSLNALQVNTLDLMGQRHASLVVVVIFHQALEVLCVDKRQQVDLPVIVQVLRLVLLPSSLATVQQGHIQV